MTKISMQSPWITYHKMVDKLFVMDDEVRVGEIVAGSGNADYEFDIVVIDNPGKYNAMTQLFPSAVQFGNVLVKINVRNGLSGGDYLVEAFKKLFEGNRAVRDIRDVVDQVGTSHTYVLFEPEVIQFFNDDLTDFNGNWSGLMQDIARDLFEANSLEISFCTADIRENIEKE